MQYGSAKPRIGKEAPGRASSRLTAPRKQPRGDAPQRRTQASLSNRKMGAGLISKAREGMSTATARKPRLHKY